ncbi:MAG: SIMPL domain-containing protein [Pseudarthrobacter sp.]|nr:SIMPL domain-containing protein [Pseudarthrobacter sp.]
MGIGADRDQGIGGQGTVTVTGTGRAEAAPDVILVALGVECRAESVADAYAAAAAGMAALTSVLRSSGVAGADIRTANLSVRADLAWRDGEGQQLVGYIAAGSLSVRLRDLKAGPGLLSEAVRAAGDAARLNNLQLMVSDESAVRARAREAAWQDALSTAQQFAELASATLGRVVSVTEQPGVPGPVPLGGMQRAAAVEALPVEPGTNRVEAAVTVVWELLP